MADYNAINITEDRQRKQVHSENKIRSPSLMGSPSIKYQGEFGTGTRLGESLENGKRGEVLPSTKKQKDQTKTSTRRISVTIEVLLHPRRQKSLLPLLKGMNLEERSTSIASIHLLHLDPHRHLLPRSLQRQEVETDRWVDDSKLYLSKIISDTISPLTWPNIPIHILKLM